MLAVLAAVLLAGSACGDDGSDDVAHDPVASDFVSTPPPAAIPAGPVRTTNLATVMDTGSPELCLGAVAESYPPQCGGPALVDWDWAQHHGTYDEQGDVRWGTYLLTGTWDGKAFTATDSIPGAISSRRCPRPRRPRRPPRRGATRS